MLKPTKDMFFNGADVTDPIDLRIEMDAIFEGGLGVGPKAHWVIYRHYHIDEPSPFMSDYTDEGNKGPAYEYEEKLIKVFSRTVTKTLTEDTGEAIGEIPTDSFIYYIRVDDIDFDIVVGYDSIFELKDEYADMVEKPRLVSDIRSKMFKVLAYQVYREQHGRKEYYSLYCKLDTVSWR